MTRRDLFPAGLFAGLAFQQKPKISQEEKNYRIVRAIHMRLQGMMEKANAPFPAVGSPMGGVKLYELCGYYSPIEYSRDNFRLYRELEEILAAGNEGP